MEHATIVAIATAPGRGAIGVIRVSGPRAKAVLQRLAPGLSPVPRVATLSTLRVDEAVVDQALVLFFPGPKSFTGEDVVELHTHGAPRLLNVVVQAALREPEVRLAGPGEFTRRALMNGRVDLTRAEAIVDLVEARSEAEVKSAAARLEGALARVLEELYQPLLQLSAELEGTLDFPDDAEDVGSCAPVLNRCLEGARRLEASARAATQVRQGGLVVLYGPVNAGKSTLFNRLVGAARALVDDEPGTTRDALEATVEVGGQLVTLVDTAGLREGAGRVEALGMERTRQVLQEADVAVLLRPQDAGAELETWRAEVPDERRLEVVGKADLLDRAGSVPAVSGLNGTGVEALLALISARLGTFDGEALVAGARHLEALIRVREALERARDALVGSTVEVVAGEVSLALSALGEVMGLDVSQARLDALFARFCIGK
ncbi:MAG: tRNA modification GTPase [Myxococcales bacterium]|nr:tRNA modification GTPase [Myxococcales bacterium]